MRIPIAIAAAGLVVPFAGPALACSPDFSGITITVGTQNGPFIAQPLQHAAEAWQAQTCGEVQIVEFPFSELYPKYTTSLITGSGDFDVIAYIPAWTPDFSAYLSTMPAEMQAGAYWDDIHPTFRERLMVWEGEVKSASMDGDMHMLNYRADLFEDPDEQAAFRERYGYDLAAPVTWDQYYDIAEFFTRPEDDLYGTAEAFRRGGQQFWYFFSHAASYTHHPDHPGTMFFDPETMDAEINNPGWVRALEDYIRSVEYNPPGALNFGSGDVRPLYAGGTVAMNLDWADSAVLAANPAESSIMGHVRTAMLPGSTEYYNAVTDQWDSFDEPVAAPFLAFGGWQLAVADASENLEAAWHYVQTATGQEQSSWAIVTANTGVNPYRLSHYEDLEPWLAIFSQVEAESYLGAQRASLDAPNVALDLRIPGFFSYTEVLEIELSRALAGDVEPQEALDRIAEEWNRLTDEFGRDAQLRAYRASMGLAVE